MLRKKLNNIVVTFIIMCLLVFSINPMFALANEVTPALEESKEQIEILQEDLLKVGFEVEGNDDEELATSLALQLEAFQAYYELSTEENDFDQVLLYLEELVNHPLQKGQEHEDIASLKEYLHTLGFLEEKDETFLFDEKTMEAVIDLQEEHNLIVNGIVDEKTFSIIEQLLEEQSSTTEEDLVEDEDQMLEPKEDEKVLEEDEVEDEVTESEEVVNESSDTKVENEKHEKSSVVMAPMSAQVHTAAQIAYVKGDRHKDVIEIKKDLAKLGFKVPGNTTNYFGAQTEKQLKAFQKYFSLGVDGSAGPATQQKLKEQANTALQQGKRHADTKKLKNDLKAIGYSVPGKGTTLYGKDTAATVKKFQTAQGLVVSGVADEVTLAKIKSMQSDKPLDTPSKIAYVKGDRHKDIIQIKKDLAKLGFKVPGNTTNYFGAQTEKQLKAFQKYFSLGVDGSAGPATQQKLKEQANTPLQTGKRHADTKKLKSDLKAIGYPVPGKGTTLYGKDTAATVKKFQTAQRLVASGIADEVTLAKIKSMQSDKPSDAPSKIAYVKGDRHKDIIQIKKDLAKLGFKVPGNTTNYFGAQTEKQLKAFQKYFSLGVDGSAGPATQKKLSEQANTPLQKGKRHNDTKKLKANLKLVGYSVPGNGTTLYGKDTAAVVKKFQKAHNLVANGIADEVTLAKISSLVGTTGSGGSGSGKTVKIFIDAGHGGSDPGAAANGLKEKDLTLDIAKRIQTHLSKYDGADIKMSRSSDQTLSLKQRTDMANSWKADFFFSVHINSFTSSSANGFESFIYNNRPTLDEMNKQKTIHDHFKSQNPGADRGKKQANFHVLRESNMTAMLAEYYFITNPSDAKLLGSASARDKMAKSTADGIAKAYGLKRK